MMPFSWCPTSGNIKATGIIAGDVNIPLEFKVVSAKLLYAKVTPLFQTLIHHKKTIRATLKEGVIKVHLLEGKLSNSLWVNVKAVMVINEYFERSNVRLCKYPIPQSFTH